MSTPITHQRTIVSATATLPALYRITLLYIEPLFALNGAFMVFFQPTKYASLMTRGSAPYDAASQHLYTQVGGAWLYFAFIEAVVLRLHDDLCLWQLLCIGMLLSDVAYSWSVVQGLGGWENWVKVGEWCLSDWTLLLSTVPLAVVRVLILLEGHPETVKRRAEEKVNGQVDGKRK